MNYLPFDLETALKHPERVVTRDGRKVTELHYFKTSQDNYPLFGVINNSLLSFTINGKQFCEFTENPKDLFLLPEVKECWVNVYEDKYGNLLIGHSKATKDESDAIREPSTGGRFIKQIRITNEPE